MYIIREVFIAKPGQAGKLAQMMKKMMDEMPGMTVMVDMVSDFNKVVIDHKTESLADFEKMMNEYVSKPKTAESKPAPHVEMYLTGKREIYRIIG